MKLRPEYQAVIDTICDEGALWHVYVKACAQMCQSLADIPPKRLTEDELRRVYDRPEHNINQALRAVQDAVLAKQREPATKKVLCRLYRETDGLISVDIPHKYRQCDVMNWFGEPFEVEVPA